MERHIFDENQPQGTMSLQNMRNALRGLFQGDLMPLRPRASMVLDDMEYSTDALAAAAFSGTGCTVTHSTTKKYGNYALSVLIDATGNRQVEKAHSLILTGYTSIRLWDYVNVASSSIQFYLKDSSGNESYWDIITYGAPNTWKEETLVLASPDSNNGTDAVLGSIVEWGFKGLDASKTYLFDDVKGVCGLQVAVEPAVIASFYASIYVDGTHLSYVGGSSPLITAPAANSRIDILTIDSAGTLAWTVGAESASPVEPTYPVDKLPICAVYCKTTMVKVVDYEDNAANPNEAYIYKDLRPVYLWGLSSFLKLADTPSSYASQALKALRVNAGSTALEFFTQTFLLLNDTPASYSGEAGKTPIVNAGETAIEFATGYAVLAGEIRIWGGAIVDVPSGYLLCDGSAISRTTYAALFTAVGTIHGVGDGSTTFNLPDLRDKFLVGAKQDDGGKPKSNIEGSLNQAGGNTSHNHSTTIGGTTSTASGNTYVDTSWINPTTPGPHSHTFSGSGTSDTKKHIPSYYVMTYMIKT